ncbi:MAG: hypothetical protein ACPGWM_06395, partial [Flavobacteriales bacterium]
MTACNLFGQLCDFHKNNTQMQSSKQKEFMSLYEPIHENFVRFCSARSYGIMETEDLVQESLAAAFHKFDKIKEKKAFSLTQTTFNVQHQNTQYIGWVEQLQPVYFQEHLLVRRVQEHIRFYY